MARPVVLRPETDIAVLVLALMVIAERIASSFRCLLIKPATGKYAPCRFNPHHSRARAAIFDRLSAFEEPEA
jgi:hypothetical protein